MPELSTIAPSRGQLVERHRRTSIAGEQPDETLRFSRHRNRYQVVLDSRHWRLLGSNGQREDWSYDVSKAFATFVDARHGLSRLWRGLRPTA